MRESNFKTSPRLRRMLVALLCISAIIYQAGAQTLVTFDNTSDLTTYFTEGLPATLPMTNRSDLGLGNSACINVLANSYDIWTTKAGYSVSGAGDVYVLSAYFKNRGNSGYGALGFSTTVANTVNTHGAPLKGLGMSFHGGGGMFENNTAETAVSWANGGMSIGPNSTWYKMILTVTAKGSNTYDLNFQIWNSDTNGVIGTKLDEKVLNGVVNTDIGGASILHVYFAAAGDRMEKIDNFAISLSGGATIIDAGKPVVVTSAISAITGNSASSGGNVTDEQGAAVTAKGVCWSTTSGPTITNSKTNDGTGTGSFTSSITGLTPGTTYYVRAYATNTNGTSYGSEVTFTTINAPMIAPGNALNFDGTSDYVNLAGTFGNWASATIEAQFINDGPTGDFQAILSASESAFVHLQVKEVASGNIAVYTDAGALDLPLPNLATDHKWKHIAISIKSGDSRLYINGEQYGSANTMAFTKILPSSTVCVGRGFQAGRYFKGSIDEVRVWSVARSQADIKSTMNTQLLGTETGLEAYYNFNEGVSCGVNTSVTSLIDLTSNNHIGTLNTFDLPTADCTSNWIQSYAMVYPVATAATAISSTAFTANWQAPSNGTVDKYKLDVSTASDFSSFVVQGQDVTSATNFSVTSLTANTQYYYRVRAENNSIGDIGGYSNVISVKTLEDSPTLSTSTGAGSFTVGNASAVVIDPNVTVSSGTTIDNGLVYINSGLISADDNIIYPASLYGVTGVYTASTGVLQLSGTATVAQYQEIFRSIQYKNTNTAAVAGSRSFTFSLGSALPFTPTGSSIAHYYEFIPNAGITWTAAKAAADAKTYYGLKGYLVTIMSAAENNFAFKSIAKYGWIGASDAASEGNWKWVTGPEAGTLFYTGAYPSGTAVGGNYNNFDMWEPNNYGGIENYAHFKSDGTWNDFADNNTGVAGYYVEYGGMTGDPSITISGAKALNIILSAPSALSYSPNPVVVTVNTDNVSSTPTVTGTVDSYSISPALPAGVTLNTTTGKISGIATVVSTQTDYTVTATNLGGSTNATFTLTVNPLPVITTNSSSGSAVIGSNGSVIDPTIVISAVPRTNVYTSASVYINAGFKSTEDKIIYPVSMSGVTGIYNATTGVLTLTGSATVAQYEAIFRTIMYQDTNPQASSGSRSFTFELGPAKGIRTLTLSPAAPTANTAQAVCGSGTVADLVATAPSGSSVRWYDAATAGTLLTSTTALVNAKTYYAESWDGTNASSTRTAVILTINVIPTKPLIVPTSTAKNKVKLCPGDNIVCSNFDNTLSYQWKLNGTNLNGQTANQYKVPVGGAGTYSLYVKNPITGCDNLSATVNVDLYSITIPVIYEKKKSDYISILIVDNTSKFYTSYSWTYADGSVLPTGIVTDRQFLVLPPANMAASYMVNITDTNACKVSSAVKSVALHTIAAKAYPTMNNGNFMVGLSDAQDGKLNVKIFNQNGILQKVYTFDNVSSEFEYQVNAAGLQAGAYTVEISLGNYVQSQKIIIR